MLPKRKQKERPFVWHAERTSLRLVCPTGWIENALRYVLFSEKAGGQEGGANYI